jgi:hypothetical protein
METHGLISTLPAFGADLHVQVAGLAVVVVLVLVLVIGWLAGRRR